MSENVKSKSDAASVLRGNYTPANDGAEGLKADQVAKNSEVRRIEEFENAARAKIGGSISFVTKLKGDKSDALLWDGDSE